MTFPGGHECASLQNHYITIIKIRSKNTYVLSNVQKQVSHMYCYLFITSEFQASELEGEESVSHLHDVNQSVEVVRGQDEAVSGHHVAPATQHQVTTQALLQGARQVLVEDGVQVVVVGSWGVTCSKFGEILKIRIKFLRGVGWMK